MAPILRWCLAALLLVALLAQGWRTLRPGSPAAAQPTLRMARLGDLLPALPPTQQLTAEQRSRLLRILRSYQEVGLELKVAMRGVLGGLSPQQQDEVRGASEYELSVANRSVPVTPSHVPRTDQEVVLDKVIHRLAKDARPGAAGSWPVTLNRDLMQVAEGLLFLEARGALTPEQRHDLREKALKVREILRRQGELEVAASGVFTPEQSAFLVQEDARLEARLAGSTTSTPAVLVEVLRKLPTRSGATTRSSGDARYSLQHLLWGLASLPPELAPDEGQRTRALRLALEHGRACEDLYRGHLELLSLLSAEQAAAMRTPSPPLARPPGSEGQLLRRLIAQLEGARPRLRRDPEPVAERPRGVSRIVLWERLTAWDEEGSLSQGQARRAAEVARRLKDALRRERQLHDELIGVLDDRQNEWVRANADIQKGSVSARLLETWLRQAQGH